MADTLPNVTLPANTWVDLYAATGVTVGTAIGVSNIGVADVYLTVTAAQPPIDYDAFDVLQRKNGVRLRNSDGDAGAWAFSPNCGGKLQVGVIP